MIRGENNTQIALYRLIAAGVAFGFMWLTNEIRKKEPKFLMSYNEENYVPCIAVSALWPVAAPIAFGIMAAKYLKNAKE